MAYIDFPDTEQGKRDRKAFWLSEDGIRLISGWRREGITIEQIAWRHIGISDRTFDRWKQESEALERALKLSQDVVNAMVEESLLRRALGYEYEEETQELVEGKMRTTKIVRKHVAPDTKACLSWLYSRRSDRWRAFQEPLDTSAEDIKAVEGVLVSIATVAEEAADPKSLPEAVVIEE